jgi:hypothetical protein
MVNYSARESQARDYVYLEYDKTKFAQNQWSNTYEVLSVGGEFYRRHLKFNDQPLHPEEEKNEEAKLEAVRRKLIDEAFKMAKTGGKSSERHASQITQMGVSPEELMAAMRATEEEVRRTAADQAAEIRNGTPLDEPPPPFIVADFWFAKLLPQLPLQRLPDKFDIRFKGHEALDGRETYIFEAKPKHEPRSSDASESDAQNFDLRIWIDQSDVQIARAQGHAIRSGLLSRTTYVAADSKNLPVGVDAKERSLLSESTLMYGSGTVVSMDWRKIKNEDWLPTRIHIKGTEILVAPVPQGNDVNFVRGSFPVEHEINFAAYKKFRVETRILSPN